MISEETYSLMSLYFEHAKCLLDYCKSLAGDQLSIDGISLRLCQNHQIHQPRYRHDESNFAAKVYECL